MTTISNISNCLFSGFLGTIIGGFITYLTQIMFRTREIKHISLHTAHYISLLLSQKQKNLNELNEMTNATQRNKAHSRLSIFPILLNVEKTDIEKILANQNFFKYIYSDRDLKWEKSAIDQLLNS